MACPWIFAFRFGKPIVLERLHCKARHPGRRFPVIIEAFDQLALYIQHVIRTSFNLWQVIERPGIDGGDAERLCVDVFRLAALTRR